MNTDRDQTLYDLAVIGGGIAGAGVAREAALRGLSVVLFEKNGFGSGASSKSSKLIHGGVRYLELAWNALKRGHFGEAYKNLRFVFHALGECRKLEKIAPELIKPLPIIIPVYSSDKRKPLMVYAGTFLYFILALLGGGAKAPRIFWTKRSLLETVPSLNPEGLKGGVQIWDRVTDDHALVSHVIALAKKQGAKCFEHAAITAYTHETDRFRITAHIDGQEKIFYSKKLANASGPWIDRTRALGGEKKGELIIPVAGSHIEFKLFLPTSMLLQAKDDRFFFVINTGGRSRVGTTEWLCPDPDSVKIPEEDVEYLLASLSRYFPGEHLSRKEILNSDAGIRPLAHSPRAKNPNEISREHELIEGPNGVLHLVGVKLTDHRRTAEEAVKKLFPKYY